ncbi:MAG: Spy/CpxP family protein refolding chaperone [Syntrophobacteraceae bacterium]
MTTGFFMFDFIFGFATAVVVILAFFVGAYYYLKHTRWKYTNIKGYMDLIPDLTEDQRRRVQDIRLSFIPHVEKIRQELCMKRISLARALFSEPTDEKRVHLIAQSILECQSELEREVIEHILEEKELLNPEQQRRFYDIILQQFAHGGLGVHDIKQERKF